MPERLVSEGSDVLIKRSVNPALDSEVEAAVGAAQPQSAVDLDTLYRTQQQPLLRRLVRRAGIERAEDLVQQVFLRLAGSPDLVEQIEKPANYLALAAVNAQRDSDRARARRLADCHQALDEAELPDYDPVCQLEARDRLTRLEQALSRMKPLTRDIFLARRLDGYSYAEIAEKTGLSVRGVEKQMSRALAQLSRFREEE